MFRQMLCLCFVNVVVVVADNFTARYPRVEHEGPKHQPRFLTFNTDEDGDVTVDLEFQVPFITIPVKKVMDGAWGLSSKGLANINLGSVILTGGILFGAVVVVPLVISLLSKNVFVPPAYRSTEEPNESWRIMTLIDQALIENNIDTTSCMQRTMCWIAKNSRTKLENGKASSQDKIIDGLLTNHWINQLIEGSAVQTAVDSGLANKNCSVHYKNCKITQNSVQTFAGKIAKYLQVK